MTPNLKASVDAAATKPHASSMNDMTREEADAKIAASEAREETKLVQALGKVSLDFESLRSDIRDLKSASVGKTSFFLGLIAAVGVIIAVMAYGGQWFGMGLQSHDVLTEAAKEGAAQALAVHH